MYYGLSTIRNRSEEVVERMLEMTMQDGMDNNDFRHRITWGLRDERETVLWTNNQAPPFVMVEEPEVRLFKDALLTSPHFKIAGEWPLTVEAMVHAPL